MKVKTGLTTLSLSLAPRRADGLPFDANVDKICYKSDDGAVNDIEQAIEPFIKEYALEVCVEKVEEEDAKNATDTVEGDTASVAKKGPVGRKFKKEVNHE